MRYLALIAALVAALAIIVGAALKPAQASPVPVAARYVIDVAKTNGVVIEGDQIQAVRIQGDSAVVLVRVRCHIVFFGMRGPTVVQIVRVREVRSGGSWSVTTLDEWTPPKVKS